jgi:hypothetical protein
VTSSGAWVNTPFTNETGTFTAQFDASPSIAPSNAVVGLSNGAQTSYSSFAALVRFNPSSDIDAYNGGSVQAYQAATVVPYSAGLTYHFRLVVNVPAKTYSAYVTPPGGTEQTLGTGFAFRAVPTSLNSWGLDTHSGSGSSTACNFTAQ